MSLAQMLHGKIREPGGDFGHGTLGQSAGLTFGQPQDLGDLFVFAGHGGGGVSQVRVFGEETEIRVKLLSPAEWIIPIPIECQAVEILAPRLRGIPDTPQANGNKPQRAQPHYGVTKPSSVAARILPSCSRALEIAGAFKADTGLREYPADEPRIRTRFRRLQKWLRRRRASVECVAQLKRVHVFEFGP